MGVSQNENQMSRIEFKGIPTFRILDYEKAIKFYVDFLGFNLDWEHRFSETEPVYMQVSKNGLTLHLTENTRFQTEVIVFVETKGIVGYYMEISKKDASIPKVSSTPWQTKQMEIEDPFGNLLRFNEKISN